MIAMFHRVARCRSSGGCLLLWLVAATASAQDLRIGIIDFYGLHHVTPSQVREVLGFREGDVLRPPGDGRRVEFVEAERRLAQIAGVESVRLGVVCCDDDRAILYVGIAEHGAPALRLRAAPTGAVRLPPEIVQREDDLERAVMDAVRRGDNGEDDSRGHALMHDPTARAIQERFIEDATTHRALLSRVLRESSDAAHRATAAEVLAYAPDKRTVVGDLVRAIRDPEESVRNNAMRALWIIAGFAARSLQRIRVPYEPLVDLLNSPVWTDRNKASVALESLSERREAALLRVLRERALPTLVEMANWKSDGHARAAFFILGRIGGLNEQAINEAWQRRDRAMVIEAARRPRSPGTAER